MEKRFTVGGNTKLGDSLLVAAMVVLSTSDAHAAEDSAEPWSFYGADAAGTRYSPLDSITPDNVAKLQVAWTYRTGELGDGFAQADKLAFEATPILVNDTLFLSTPTDIVIALDPATGRERWRYDPRIARNVRYAEATSRGVAAWQDSQLDTDRPCARRIFIGTLDARLIALDAATGKPCDEFAHNGTIDLAADIGPTQTGQYAITSPPTIAQDTVITGSAIGDNRAAHLERGTVRAFDARTGALRWTFEPLSEETQRQSGAANAWAVFSVDAALGLVYVPTGSPSPDFYGALRNDSAVRTGSKVDAKSGNKNGNYANSLVALRIKDGSVAWSQQLVHHDLWDYDLAAQPTLVDIDRDGKSIAAVVQATKMGTVFIFDRETGTPINEIVERPVPPSDVEGETSSATQPFSTIPPLVSQAAITPDNTWGLTFYDRARCRAAIRALRSEGIFTPPSVRGSIESPGYAGGVNWGGTAVDRERQILIAAVNHIPMVVRLLPRDSEAAKKRPPTDMDRTAQTGTPYVLERGPLLSPFGLPCTRPPWGTLAAIDLQRNTVLWQRPLGSTEGFAPWFVPSREIGMPNMGGPIVTASGIIFVGAATDNYLRAFDVGTGRKLWQGKLPAGGQATPMTYELGGRQFVVIAAGGHGSLGTKRGDYVVAFALPDDR